MNSIEQAAIIACRSLLPDKSKDRYNQAYENFIKCCTTEDVGIVDVIGIGYQPRKSQVYTKDDISKILVEGPDEIYLIERVVAIFVVSGIC